MKRSFFLPIVFGLIASCVAAVRFLPRGYLSQVTQSKPNNLSSTNSGNNVSYGGVSFSYDSSLAAKVESKTVAAMDEGKPSDIIPEHPSFTLVGYPRIQNMRPSDPEIKVFSIVKFRKAMHHASDELAKVTYPPMEDLGPAVDTEVRVLKELLAAKPTTKLGGFLAKARGEPGCSAEMPFLPMWEACQAFSAHVRYINFKNGQGVFFLTQWDTETTQISNEGLEYAYQGITNDGQYWIYAEFSVAAPFLPKGDEPEVIAWEEKNYLLSHRSKQYQDYARPVLAKLEALPASKFQPNLELLEQLIGSLEVKAN
jgi:hypothetical protein